MKWEVENMRMATPPPTPFSWAMGPKVAPSRMGQKCGINGPRLASSGRARHIWVVANENLGGDLIEPDKQHV